MELHDCRALDDAMLSQSIALLCYSNTRREASEGYWQFIDIAGSSGKAATSSKESGALSSNFSSETRRILERVGQPGTHTAQHEEKQQAALEPPKSKAVTRDWTIAEQLRHPVNVVGLQWSAGSLQRGVSAICSQN